MILSTNKVTTIAISADTRANLAPCRYSNAFITILVSFYIRLEGNIKGKWTWTCRPTNDASAFNGEPCYANDDNEN